MRTRRTTVIVLCAALTALGGCGGDDQAQPVELLPQGGDEVRTPRAERGPTGRGGEQERGLPEARKPAPKDLPEPPPRVDP
jgi:hypothetical protein